MEENNKRLSEITSDAFENLIAQALDEYKEDIEEANDFLDRIKTAIGSGKMGLETHGALLNETLRTKGAARDRQIKLINLVLARLKAKEAFVKDKDDVMLSATPEQTMLLLDAMKKADEAKNFGSNNTTQLNG